MAAGANNLSVCWGPVVGSKTVTYRTAVVLGGLSLATGVLAFGPRTYTPYGGFLQTVQDLNAHPELTLYAIMWTIITPVAWQLLAIQYQIVVPAYLGTGKVRNPYTVVNRDCMLSSAADPTQLNTMHSQGHADIHQLEFTFAPVDMCAVASTIGAALVFPGYSKIQFGQPLSSPPFLSGLGSILLSWLLAPLISAVLVTPSYLMTRATIFRREDPFHLALWVSTAACSQRNPQHQAMFIHRIYTTSTPIGTSLNSTCINKCTGAPA